MQVHQQFTLRYAPSFVPTLTLLFNTYLFSFFNNLGGNICPFANICSSVNRYPMHCRRTRDVDCYQHFTRQTRDQDISHHHVALVVVMLILPRHTRYNSRKTTTTSKSTRTSTSSKSVADLNNLVNRIHVTNPYIVINIITYVNLRNIS